MSNIRVATSALTKTIYAGELNKKGDSFLTGKTDVTSDVLKSIIEYIGIDKTHVVCSSGKSIYEISVKKVG